MRDGDQPPIGILLCTRKTAEPVQLPDKEAIAAFLHQAVQELGG